MTTMTRRWLARASFALMLAAVVLVLAVAGWHSLTLIAFAAIGVCAVLAGGYWFLANRGVRRWIALALVVAAPVLILVAFARASLLWVAVVAVALMVAAAGTARAALGTGGQDAAMPAVPAARPRRPFLIMNPQVGRGEGHQVRAEGQGARSWAPRWRCWRARGPWTWPRWPARRSPMAPTCSAWPAGTGPRRWWPASPPSTACRSW